MLCFIADLHFDLYTRLSTPRPSGLSSRLEDIAECWRWAVSIAKDRGAEQFIVAGDLFNNRTSIELTILDTVCRLIHEACDALGDVAVLVGNHDSHLRTPSINSLQTMAGFANVIETPLITDHSWGSIGYVPWTDDLTALREGVDRVIAAQADILVSHALVDGAVPHGGGIPVEYFRPDCFKRVFLGDVHDGLDLPPGNVHYIGSPLQLDYRDAGRFRGILLYDPAIDTIERIENTVSPRFHVITSSEDLEEVATDVHDFIRVNASDDETGKALTVQAKGLSQHVESNYVETVAKAPRIALDASETDQGVLERYVRFVRPGASDSDITSLVKAGLGILLEAKK